ncbi:MAG TPA: DUF420 domain-containing protein [Bacteroidia bacterium]
MSDKAVFRFVIAISIFVFAVVVILNRKVLPRPDEMPSFVSCLPLLNATLNGSCTVLLLFSLWAIKKKNIALHKKINLTAFVLSSLFLVSYIMYHWMALETTFPKDNPLRPVYLCILISHIILAALVLPMILISFYFGLKNEVIKHRKIVRFSYPIWLYVTITGVVVYLMVKPYYPF